MDDEVVQIPLKNEGEVRKLLSRLALSQLRDVALRSLYEQNGFVGLGLRKEDLSPTSTEAIADALAVRIQAAKSKLEPFDGSTWPQIFASAVD